MAKHDNTGFPLSYCLLSTADSIEIGKRSKALKAWASCLKEKYGIIPKIAHTDKDMAEIGMLRDVWDPKVQLCWWHLRKAVRNRLATNKLTTTPYNALRAKTEFPWIDIAFVPPGRSDPEEHEGGIHDDFIAANSNHYMDPNSITLRIRPPEKLQPVTGTKPNKDPDTSPQPRPALADQNKTHHSRHLQSSRPAPPSPIPTVPKVTLLLPTASPATDTNNSAPDNSEKDTEKQETQRHNFCPMDYRESIVDLIECHYCAHPIIPGYSHPSPEGIRAWAVKEMYEFCKKYDLREAWAYLWENWYRPGRWELWARLSHPEFIPILKTTMMLEAQ